MKLPNPWSVALAISEELMNNTDILTTYLTVAEEKRFFNVIKHTAGHKAQRDYWMYKLLRESGIRIGTLCGLTLKDVAGLREGGYLQLREEICKGTNSYELYLHKELFKCITMLVKLAKNSPQSTYLVPGQGGNPISPRTVQYRCKLWDEISGLNLGITPHWFRHTKAHRIMQGSTASNPRMVVKRNLGHKTMQATDIYTKQTREDFEQGASL